MVDGMDICNVCVAGIRYTWPQKVVCTTIAQVACNAIIARRLVRTFNNARWTGLDSFRRSLYNEDNFADGISDLAVGLLSSAADSRVARVATAAARRDAQAEALLQVQQHMDLAREAIRPPPKRNRRSYFNTPVGILRRSRGGHPIMHNEVNAKSRRLCILCKKKTSTFCASASCGQPLCCKVRPPSVSTCWDVFHSSDMLPGGGGGDDNGGGGGDDDDDL